MIVLSMCPKHKKKVDEMTFQPSIASLFSNNETESNNEHDVRSAELHITKFLVEHNVPLSAADHCGALFRKVFHDSKIAKGYHCARTKATLPTALVNFQAL